MPAPVRQAMAFVSNWRRSSHAAPSGDLTLSTTRKRAVRAGILWMLVTTGMFVGQDAISRLLLVNYPILEVTWARFFFHALLATALVLWRQPSLVITHRPGLQLLRSAMLLGVSLTANVGIRFLPFVDYSAIIWVAPVLVTALSAWLLREKVGWAGWLSVLLGMLGVLVIVKPFSLTFSLAMLMPFAAALGNAIYQIMTRLLRTTEPPLTTLFYTCISGVLISSVALPFVGIVPNVHDAFLMIALGSIGCLSHFCLIRAFAAAPAAVVAPFGYTALLWANFFSLVLFAEIPAISTLLGAVLIVAGGLCTLVFKQKG